MLVLWIRLECESEIGQPDTFHLILELNLYYELFSLQAHWTSGFILSQCVVEEIEDYYWKLPGL